MPQNQKISAEEKERILIEYLDGQISLTEAALQGTTTKIRIMEWARNYEEEGIAAFFTHRQRVYSPELKLQAVNDYKSGGGSLSALCKKYKIRSERQLSNWIKIYNAHGDFGLVKHSEGGSYMKHRRDTTQEERIQIAKECIACGKNCGAMSIKYNVSYQQARTWMLRFEELGEAGLEDRRGKRKKDQTPRTELEKAQIEIEQLKHKLYLSEMENTLLKKLDEIERRDASHK